MQYLAVFEKDTNSCGAYMPDLPGCVAIGETMEEVRGLITEAIQFSYRRFARRWRCCSAAIINSSVY